VNKVTDTQYLIGELEKAKHSASLCVCGNIDDRVISSCLQMAERGVAVELFFNECNKEFLRNNQFILNRCFQFISRGGSIYIASDSLSPAFSVDYQQTFHDEFRRMREASTPYLQEPDDIRIRIKTSAATIVNGDAIELSWEVDNADEVLIQGVGEVEHHGSRTILLAEDTIIKIGASNKNQVQLRTLPIRVINGETSISYDLGFISPNTGNFNTLVNSNAYPHVYGVSKGHDIKLMWNVSQAAEVTIDPFGITTPSGEFTFTPTSSLDIEIRATISDRIVTRKIHLHVFPIILFSGKLVETPIIIKPIKEFYAPRPGTGEASKRSI
jgi:hypothetical protein